MNLKFEINLGPVKIPSFYLMWGWRVLCVGLSISAIASTADLRGSNMMNDVECSSSKRFESHKSCASHNHRVALEILQCGFSASHLSMNVALYWMTENVTSQIWVPWIFFMVPPTINVCSLSIQPKLLNICQRFKLCSTLLLQTCVFVVSAAALKQKQQYLLRPLATPLFTASFG